MSNENFDRPAPTNLTEGELMLWNFFRDADRAAHVEARSLLVTLAAERSRADHAEAAATIFAENEAKIERLLASHGDTLSPVSLAAACRDAHEKAERSAEFRLGVIESARSVLHSLRDRLDEFTFQEFSSVLLDQECDGEGRPVVGRIAAERDAALARVQAVEENNAEAWAESERLRMLCDEAVAERDRLRVVLDQARRALTVGRDEFGMGGAFLDAIDELNKALLPAADRRGTALGLVGKWPGDETDEEINKVLR